MARAPSGCRCRARPVGELGRTRLVVGGVQWLSISHLDVLQTVLKERRLSHITVIIKGHGAGFHLPGVDGSAQVGARCSVAT